MPQMSRGEPKSAENTFGRAVTLKDVAQAAGVSVSTVSRVLDERSPRTRSAAADRVRAIAQELGYRRNLYASGLRRGESGTMGVLVPRLSDQVMALMYEALERAARRRNVFTVVATCGDDPDDEQRTVRTLLDRGVDALILAAARLGDPLPESLRNSQVPHVLVLRTDGVSAASLGEDETGGYLAVRHLLDLGHRRIGLVAGPQHTSTGQDRLTGAQRALREAGITPDPALIVATGFGLEDGTRAGMQLLAGPNRPTAIFAANDMLAIGVLSAAQSFGLTIGQDLSLVGYNDLPVVSRLAIPITSVRTAFDQIATAALELLEHPGEGPQTRRAMPTLMPRASTGPVR